METPVVVKPGSKTIEGWLAVAVASLGALSASGLLSGLDPKYGAAVALAASIALMIQRLVLKFQAASLNAPSTTPGELLSPEATAETVALTKALSEALDRFKADRAASPK